MGTNDDYLATTRTHAHTHTHTHNIRIRMSNIQRWHSIKLGIWGKEKEKLSFG